MRNIIRDKRNSLYIDLPFPVIRHLFFTEVRLWFKIWWFIEKRRFFNFIFEKLLSKSNLNDKKQISLLENEKRFRPSLNERDVFL